MIRKEGIGMEMNERRRRRGRRGRRGKRKSGF